MPLFPSKEGGIHTMQQAFSANTSELEAVNIMLSGIGEAPTNTLVGEITTDVSLAKNILLEISRETQLEGWTWNTEHNVPLTPNTSQKEIKLPSNVLRVFFREPDSRVFTVRGNRLYNNKTHSFIFADTTRPITACSMTFYLPFTELPEAARRYITLKALRVFQERSVGAVSLSQYQRDDENRARGLLMKEERRAGRHNMLQGYLAPTGGTGWTVFSTLQRLE